MSNSSTAKREPLRCDPELCGDILASIADAVITTDGEGRVSYLNAVAASLTGWMQHEALGVSLAEVINPVDLETRGKIEDRTRRAMDYGVIADVASDLLLISKDGTEHPIESTAAPFRSGDGRVAGVVWTIRDVSVCRRQEHVSADAVPEGVVQNSEERYRRLFRTAKDGIFILDAQTLKVIDANIFVATETDGAGLADSANINTSIFGRPLAIT